MPAPTPQQISTLYKNSLAVSRQFASYNFRTYFVHRTETHFAESAIPPATDKRALTEWYNARVGELGVLRRSAVVNRIYEGPRLVVEKDEKIVEEQEADNLLEHVPKPGESTYTC